MKNTRNILAASLLCALACSAAQAATITVNSDADAQNQTGICTLRDAIASVNDGNNFAGGCASSSSGSLGTADTIEFSLPPGITTIAVESGGEIEITENLIINGPVDASGNPLITLDANFSGTNTPGNRIFNVTGGTSLTITGVTFRNGNAGSDYGGAIEVGAGNLTLTLEQCAFEGNQAEYGGAVDIDSSSSTVIIRNSTFTGNEATSSGGAVYANDTAISNSTFSGNEATSDGGAVFANNTATISNSTFSGNEATNYGGAVYSSTATISNSTFSGNEANDYDGGAVAANTATISNSTFSGNEAGDWGGAVKASTATISNSTFSGNAANNSGGAVYAFFSLDARHLTLLNNTAGTDGQALYVEDSSGTATLHNSIIIGSDSSAQCAGGVALTGSYNLEGWAASATAALADTTTCGTTMPVSTGATLNTIIESTLANNGGPTQTLALPSGSPAIGAADPLNGTSQMLDSAGNWTDATLDQRGFGRLPATSGRSVGAYEAEALNAAIITDSLPEGTVGIPYTQQMQAQSTPAVPLTFSSGTLPANLSINNSSGEITGTPQAAGTFNVTITIGDAEGRQISRTYSLTIRALPTGSGSTPIPVLPVPLLLGLAAAVGLLGRRRLTQRA